MHQLVKDEWERSGHMAPGHLPRGWRAERHLYELRMPDAGWWVDIENPDSIAAISKALGDDLASTGVDDLDLSALTGPNRESTTLIATWVRDRTLYDGSKAHGICYPSRHATGTSWAYWMRAVDDGGLLSAEPIASWDGDGSAIGADDPDLTRTAARFDITIW